MRAVLVSIGSAALLCACYGGGETGEPGPVAGSPAPAEPSITIGVPDEVTGLDFVPLQSGGDIPLESFGQGGTHASLAIRCEGFGDRAFVDITLTNLDDPSMFVMTPAASRPPLLLCRDEMDAVCDLIPVFVLTGGLADPSEKDDLPIEVRVDARNEAGLEGTASMDGVLRRR